jgi:hypothetical protein
MLMGKGLGKMKKLFAKNVGFSLRTKSRQWDFEIASIAKYQRNFARRDLVAENSAHIRVEIMEDAPI